MEGSKRSDSRGVVTLDRGAVMACESHQLGAFTQLQDGQRMAGRTTPAYRTVPARPDL